MILVWFCCVWNHLYHRFACENEEGKMVFICLDMYCRERGISFVCNKVKKKNANSTVENNGIFFKNCFESK